MSCQRSYTTAEKLKVVRYAQAHGNRAASHEFDDIAESNIRLWRRQKEHLQALPRMKMAKRGKGAAYPELEAKLNEWIEERRQQGSGVSIAEVRMKALTIAKTCTNIARFKASYGWGDQFMNRHGLLVRHQTTIVQKLPMVSDTKLLQFQKKGFLKCSIFNTMDGSEDDALWMDPRDNKSAEGELPECEEDNDLYYLD
uniref:HTH CENPB-type domain-containing protein n=1 Tax=Pelodiscus sinensis TaxID=13735 RepID=K7GI91_PELSI